MPAKITDFAVMLDRGEIEAFIGWEPASAAAIAKAKDVHYISQLPPIPNAESLELVFQPKIAKENPDLIVRFVRATVRAMNYIGSHSKDEIAQIVAKKMNDPSAAPVARMALDSVVLTEPRLDMPSTRPTRETIAEQGDLQGPGQGRRWLARQHPRLQLPRQGPGDDAQIAPSIRRHHAARAATRAA